MIDFVVYFLIPMGVVIFCKVMEHTDSFLMELERRDPEVLKGISNSLQKSKKIPTPEEIQKRESEKDFTIKKEIETCKNFIASLIEKECTTQKFKVRVGHTTLQGVGVSFDLLKKHIDKLIVIFNDAGWGLILDDTYLHIYPHFRDSEKKVYR